MSPAIKRRGVQAEIWTSWYGVERDISESGKKLGWFGDFGGAPSLGFCCRHLATPSPKSAEEGRTVGGPSLFAMNLAQKVSPGSQVPSGRPSLEQTTLQKLVPVLCSGSELRNPICSILCVVVVHAVHRHLSPSLRPPSYNVALGDWCGFGSRCRRRTTI